MMNLGEKISEEECDAMVEVRESVMIINDHCNVDDRRQI